MYITKIFVLFTAGLKSGYVFSHFFVCSHRPENARARLPAYVSILQHTSAYSFVSLSFRAFSTFRRIKVHKWPDLACHHVAEKQLIEFTRRAKMLAILTDDVKIV
jgi:hypothetical protein